MTAADIQDAEVIDKTTGEVITSGPLAIREEPPAGFSGFMGVASLAVSKADADKLMTVLPDDVHDILPTGEVYVSQVQYRRLLNGTFGPGSWALVPRGEFIKQGKTICREYALVVNGRFVAQAVGEQDYHESNERMSYATAAEGVKSNALTRCCKDLGIASECWDKRWCEAWIAKYAVKVWLESGGKPQWRRKDAAPFWNEKKGQGQGASPAKAAPPAPAAPAHPYEESDGERGPGPGDPFGDSLDGPPSPAPAAAPTTTGPEIPNDTTMVITLPQRRRLFGIAMTLFGDKKKAEAEIRASVERVTGQTSTEALRQKQYERAVTILHEKAGVPEEKR